MNTFSMSYREAIQAALREALEADSRVFILGEDVGAYGGTYAMTRGLLADFGDERVRDTPLSESAFVGAAIGAAINGMRPIVEIMTVNFALLALDQLLNTAATILHMSGGQFPVPLVVRMTTGAGRQLAAQHSHSLEGWLAHIPGLKVLCPATVMDARWMLDDALRDPNPVLLFEHCLLFPVREEISLSRPDNFNSWRSLVRQEGSDVTVVTYGGMVPRVLQAAAVLEKERISVEVVDLRCLRPLDDDPFLSSVSKTGRAVVVDEGWRSGGLSAEICTRMVERCFFDLQAPLSRVCSDEIPIPYPRHLEQAAVPQIDTIVAAVRRVVHGDI